MIKIECNEAEFIKALHKFNPKKVYRSRREKWLFYGYFSADTRNDPDYVNHFFGYCKFDGLDELMKRDGEVYFDGQMVRAKNHIVIENQEWRAGANILNFGCCWTVLKIPVTFIKYAFIGDKEIFVCEMKILPKLKYAGFVPAKERKRLIERGFILKKRELVTEIQEPAKSKYLWLLPSNDDFQVPLPNNSELIDGELKLHG